MSTHLDAADGPPAATSRTNVGLKWLIGIAIGAAFTWLTARNWPVDTLVSGSLESGQDSDGVAVLLMRGTDGEIGWSLQWSALAGYLLILTGIHLLRVWRWRPLIQSFEPLPFAQLNRVGAIGFMSVFLLPLRLGEFVRPYLLSRSSNIAFGSVLSTIAVERVLDGLMVALVLFCILATVPEALLVEHPQVQTGATIALAVFGSAMLLLAATAVARRPTITLIRRMVGRISVKLADRIVELATTFVDGLAALGSVLALLEFIALTITYWGLNGLGIWLMARGFGLDVPLAAGYAMMGCVVIGMMIPNSPGNVGSFWYFMLLPAALYGLDRDASPVVGFALAVWFIQTTQMTAFGIWGLWAHARASRRDPDDKNLPTDGKSHYALHQ